MHGWSYLDVAQEPPRRDRTWWRFVRRRRALLGYVAVALVLAAESVMCFIPSTHTLGWVLLKGTTYALSHVHG